MAEALSSSSFQISGADAYRAPDVCFHTYTTTLIHDLKFDVFTFKGIILKQLIQGITFIEYASCQITK